MVYRSKVEPRSNIRGHGRVYIACVWDTLGDR
jgi:hypothetical protein